MGNSSRRRGGGDTRYPTNLPAFALLGVRQQHMPHTPTQPPMKGRYAPSPTGRMHLGNAFSALVSWLSARRAGGSWVLRIEDLDPQRSRREYALQLQDDLHWLGLDWDEGGVDADGPAAPYSQSLRGDIYAAALERLRDTGLLYPCFCTRADIMATQAPHQSDGRVVYAGTCRPPLPCRDFPERRHALRIAVGDAAISFSDTIFGPQTVKLAEHCGDFVVRRADGAWAYQLAVVVDDAAMGATEVVRGADLLLSSAQQIYLYRLLGLPEPEFFHVPLICNREGRRLSKRDGDVDFGALRARHTPEEVVGLLGHLAGLIPKAEPITAAQLVPLFASDKIPRQNSIILP